MEMESLVDCTFTSVTDLQKLVQARTRLAVELDTIEVNDMFGFFALRLDAGPRVFYVFARRPAPWSDFRIRKVEAEASARWLKYTRWRPRRRGYAGESTR